MWSKIFVFTAGGSISPAEAVWTIKYGERRIFSLALTFYKYKRYLFIV